MPPPSLIWPHLRGPVLYGAHTKYRGKKYLPLWAERSYTGRGHIRVAEWNGIPSCCCCRANLENVICSRVTYLGPHHSGIHNKRLLGNEKRSAFLLVFWIDKCPLIIGKKKHSPWRAMVRGKSACGFFEEGESHQNIFKFLPGMLTKVPELCFKNKRQTVNKRVKKIDNCPLNYILWVVWVASIEA